MLNKKDYYVDQLNQPQDEEFDCDPNEFGVFHEDKGNHCYFYGTQQECEEYIENINC